MASERGDTPLRASRDAIAKTSDAGFQGFLNATCQRAVTAQDRESGEEEEDPLEPREH